MPTRFRIESDVVLADRYLNCMLVELSELLDLCVLVSSGAADNNGLTRSSVDCDDPPASPPLPLPPTLPTTPFPDSTDSGWLNLSFRTAVLGGLGGGGGMSMLTEFIVELSSSRRSSSLMLMLLLVWRREEPLVERLELSICCMETEFMRSPLLMSVPPLLPFMPALKWLIGRLLWLLVLGLLFWFVPIAATIALLPPPAPTPRPGRSGRFGFTVSSRTILFRDPLWLLVDGVPFRK